VAALEAGNFQCHQIRMPRRELRRPHFVIRTARIRILPGVGDVERVSDNSGTYLFAEQSLEHVFIERQGVLRENRIAQFLELLHNLVIQTGIMMIRPPQHHNPDAIFAFQLIENLAAASDS
jgi:hypothetical protein